LKAALGSERPFNSNLSLSDLSMKKNVVVVEDNPGLQTQLLKVLESASDIKCLGAFTSGEEAVPFILKKNPEVVLMDIKLPGKSGIQCVAEIKKVRPEIQVIMVTVYEDSERIFRALKAGASGYLIKSSPPEQLIEAVRDAHKGGSPMSSPIARKVVEHFYLLGPAVQETDNLSPREKEVLDLLAMGFIYKEIGSQLKIGAETVRSHVKNICQKMHVSGRIEAVAKRRSETY
jgi:DNA-binding NarL/FixJ family response regulator